MPRLLVATALLLLGALSAAAADALKYSSFHGGCASIDFDTVVQSISEARTCAESAEIHRICSDSKAFGLRRPFANALEERCTKDFEGRLAASEQKYFDRVLEKCGQGLETPDGRTTVTAVAVDALCRANAAVARSKRYWRETPFE